MKKEMHRLALFMSSALFELRRYSKNNSKKCFDVAKTTLSSLTTLKYKAENGWCLMRLPDKHVKPLPHGQIIR